MRRRLSRSGWLLVVAALALVVVGGVVLGGCGGGDTKSPDTTAAQSTATTVSASGGGQGEAVAKEILASYDELVAKVAELANAKPDPATLKPQLDELYASWEPKMAELNTKYLALRDADIAEFGACNSYLGNYRGQHVLEKDNTLTPALQYYNLELGDQEMVALISQKPSDLLNIAVKQN